MTEPTLEELQILLDQESQKITEQHTLTQLAKDKAIEAEKAYHAAVAEKRGADQALAEASNNKRMLEKALASARRVQEAEEDKKRRWEEYKKLSDELDDLTRTAKWREWAYEHQIEGGKQLTIARRGILGDKRGLGKTLTSLIWLDMLQAKKILVVAINDVVPQFLEEIQSWAPDRKIMPMQNLPPSQRAIMYPMLEMMDEYVVTINFEAWRRDKTIVDDLVSAGIDTIIIDEAHKIKSSDKLTARGVFQVAYRPNHCDNCGAVANHFGPWNVNGKLVDYRPVAQTVAQRTLWAAVAKCNACGITGEHNFSSTVKNVLSMTGTPILNKPQELFSLLYLVNPERYPTETTFMNDYCYQVGNRWTFRPGGEAKLTEKMSDFFLQRNREDAGITIPPPAVTIHMLDKDKVKYQKQYEAERQLQQAATLILENGDSYDMLYLLEIILRERQVMTWPAGIVLKDRETKEIICKFDVEESQKLDAVSDLLDDLIDEGERVIVFSQFKEPLNELQRRFYNRGTVLATGDTPTWVRDQIREDFDLKTFLRDGDRRPKYSAAFATYKAFSTGVNLNAARHVILLDDEWNPGMEDQAIGRIDRMNSTDKANVHIFRVKDSIDDFMAGILKQKSEMLEGFDEGISANQLMKGLKGEY